MINILIMIIITTSNTIFLIRFLPGAGQDSDEMSYWGRQRTITPKVDDDEDFDWPPDSWAPDSWALEPNSH